MPVSVDAFALLSLLAGDAGGLRGQPHGFLPACLDGSVGATCLRLVAALARGTPFTLVLPVPTGAFVCVKSARLGKSRVGTHACVQWSLGAVAEVAEAGYQETTDFTGVKPAIRSPSYSLAHLASPLADGTPLVGIGPEGPCTDFEFSVVDIFTSYFLAHAHLSLFCARPATLEAGAVVVAVLALLHALVEASGCLAGGAALRRAGLAPERVGAAVLDGTVMAALAVGLARDTGRVGCGPIRPCALVDFSAVALFGAFCFAGDSLTSHAGRGPMCELALVELSARALFGVFCFASCWQATSARLAPLAFSAGLQPLSSGLTAGFALLAFCFLARLLFLRLAATFSAPPASLADFRSSILTACCAVFARCSVCFFDARRQDEYGDKQYQSFHGDSRFVVP